MIFINYKAVEGLSNEYPEVTILRKGLDTVESLSVEGKGSKTLGKIFLVL